MKFQFDWTKLSLLLDEGAKSGRAAAQSAHQLPPNPVKP